MREILFRGKTITDNKWVYGYYTSDKNGHYILVNYNDNIKQHTVYENSIGQWTGKHDKNGVKMFEGDIVAKPFSIVLLTVKYNEQNSQYMLYKPEGIVYCLPTMIPNSNEIKIVDNQFDKIQREKNTITNNLDINIKRIKQIEKALNISFTEQQMQFLLFGKSHEDMKDWERGTGKTLCSFVKSILETPEDGVILYIKQTDIFCSETRQFNYDFFQYDIDKHIYRMSVFGTRVEHERMIEWLKKLSKHDIIKFYYNYYL